MFFITLNIQICVTKPVLNYNVIAALSYSKLKTGIGQLRVEDET